MMKKLFWPVIPVIIVLLVLISTPVFAGVVLESYALPARTVVVDLFTVADNPVYMKATGISASIEYRFDYRDAGANPILSDTQTSVGDEVISQIIPSDYPSATAGTWTCEIWRVSNSTLKATDTFVVNPSAIPEFPTVLSGAVVVGICFGIFNYLKRRMSAKA